MNTKLGYRAWDMETPDCSVWPPEGIAIDISCKYHHLIMICLLIKRYQFISGIKHSQSNRIPFISESSIAECLTFYRRVYPLWSVLKTHGGWARNLAEVAAVSQSCRLPYGIVTSERFRRRLNLCTYEHTTHKAWWCTQKNLGYMYGGNADSG